MLVLLRQALFLGRGDDRACGEKRRLADALRGCRFSIDALCACVQSVEECRAYADDLCALLREQDI